MSVTVHKQSFALAALDAEDKITLSLPAWSEVLTVAQQDPADPFTLSVWYRCSTRVTAMVEHTFYVIGTGHPAPMAKDARYLNTLMFERGAIVLHVFVEKRRGIHD